MLVLALPLNPVSASRPRVAVRGGFASAYYAGPYQKYKTVDGPIALDGVLNAMGWQHPFTGPVAVTIDFIVKRPKKTKLAYPKPDVDNYAKAILDLLQPSVIQDDLQVIALAASKQWTPNHLTAPLTLVTVVSYDTNPAPSVGLRTTWESMTTAMRTALDAATTDTLMELLRPRL